LFVTEITPKTIRPVFGTKKVAHEPRKERLNFGGNSAHVTSGLALYVLGGVNIVLRIYLFRKRKHTQMAERPPAYAQYNSAVNISCRSSTVHCGLSF